MWVLKRTDRKYNKIKLEPLCSHKTGKRQLFRSFLISTSHHKLATTIAKHCSSLRAFPAVIETSSRKHALLKDINLW